MSLSLAYIGLAMGGGGEEHGHGEEADLDEIAHGELDTVRSH